MPVSLKSASRPAPLEGEHFDVIGGAIIEAGIARDATLRGLRVALFEKSDSGFSQRCSEKTRRHAPLHCLSQNHLKSAHECEDEPLSRSHRRDASVPRREAQVESTAMQINTRLYGRNRVDEVGGKSQARQKVIAGYLVRDLFCLTGLFHACALAYPPLLIWLCAHDKDKG